MAIPYCIYASCLLTTLEMLQWNIAINRSSTAFYSVNADVLNSIHKIIVRWHHCRLFFLSTKCVSGTCRPDLLFVCLLCEEDVFILICLYKESGKSADVSKILWSIRYLVCGVDTALDLL